MRRRFCLRRTKTVTLRIAAAHADVIAAIVRASAVIASDETSARVKGKTENALLAMPFKAVYIFRPAYIQPLHGIRSRTGWYNAMYAVMAPLYPLWKTLILGYVTTTEQIGLAMIAIAKSGYSKRILGSRDISELGTR